MHFRARRRPRPISISACATRRQSTAKLPVIMLSLALLNLMLWSVFVVTVGVQPAYFTDFVTIRRHDQNWTDESAGLEESIQPSERNVKFDYNGIEQRYKLRFRPVQAMPRLFWHKFPPQQQQEGSEEPEMPEVTTTAAPVEPPEMPPVEPPVETTTIAPTPPATEEPLSPTEAMMTTTTAATITTMSTNTTMKPASTTMTTIMKPPNRFNPQLGNTLKNLLLFGSPVQANLIQKPLGKTKSKGFLSLFEVIKFANTKCTVAMGDIRTMHGVCYHEFECKSLGGIPTEKCAEGVGVCCIFLTGCGDATNQPIVYFESPNYPNAVRELMICVLIVNLRKNVQQLRLDFLMFELNRPTNGDCIDDQFIVSGHNGNFVVPVLCGINTGQHIYVHVGNSFENKIYLSFFAKVPTGGRSFNIKISQLEDDLAPDNCLQYYTETEGVVKSFNYDIEGTIVDNKEATYLNNLNYAICMPRNKETCSITYTTEQQGGDQLDFQIINKDDDEIDLVPDGQAGAGIFNCPDDFIAINQVRLCGERFNDGIDNEDFTVNAPVRDIAAGPIILPFRSDVEYVGRGFRLVYKQELCV